MAKKKKLVIVESPGKIKKISHILGSDYQVKASMGHIIDLPRKGLGIDIKNNFEPTYEPIPKKKEVIADLKRATKDVDEVYLASDSDNEGHFISYALKRVLQRKGLTFRRVIFDSITEEEILKAFSSPGDINENLVEAQKARRLVDRLTGFKISPLLWRQGKNDKEPSRSAGRVQSVGLQMIVDRQHEIDIFVPIKYWTVEALVSDKIDKFTLELQTSDKHSINSQEKADKFVNYLQEQDFIVENVNRSEEQKRPYAPFTTSTLQQAASSILNWTPKKTMAVAQKLYESGHCVHPDSLVMGGDGKIYTIQEFVENQIPDIVGVDNTGKATILRVDRHMVREAPSVMYKITTTKNHTITLTGEHPMLTLKADGQHWTETKNLVVGDYIAEHDVVISEKSKQKTIFDLLHNLPVDRQSQVLVLLSENIPKHKIKRWVQTEDIAESTTYKYVRNKTLTLTNYLKIRKVDRTLDTYYKGLQYRSAQSNPVYPKLEITPELMRWVGLVLGDSCIHQKSISVHKPDPFPTLYSSYYGDAFADYKERASGKTSHISKIFLEALGYSSGKKSATLFISPFIMQLDKESLRGFISGCWDSDGSIHQTTNRCSCKVSINSRSKIFIEQLRLLLLRFNIIASLHTDFQENINRRSCFSTRHIKASGDQHYLYINSGSWDNFYSCINEYCFNRQSQLQRVNECMGLRSCQRDKESFVPINEYVALLRQHTELTKQTFRQQIGVDYWNYCGKIRPNRTRLSCFNKQQVAQIGLMLSDPLLTELGTNDICWERIKNIEIIDNSTFQCCNKVYDLTTSNHNFMCNGFVSHNCSYMRTDSTALSEEAIKNLVTLIPKVLSKQYLPPKPHIYPNKNKSAQEAHEAIRPTNLTDDLSQILSCVGGDEAKLLEIIWRRTVASQMAVALFDKVEVVVRAGKAKLKVTGQVQKFDGFLKVWTHTDTKENKLPDLKVKQQLEKIEIKAVPHETKPPARYNGASLIKELEANGVGRPSTYASIIDTLLDRGYVEMDKKAFVPTQKGIEVSTFLKKYFSNIINVKFTSQMEEDLDKIAAGDKTRLELLTSFYKELAATIDEAKVQMSTNEVSTEKCPECNSAMFVKLNRQQNQRFLACSNKECKKTFNIDESGKPIERKIEKLDEKCPECGGDLIKKVGKNGPFYGCSGYRDGCKVTASVDGVIRVPPKSSGRKCSKCKKGFMVERINRSTGDRFWGCSRFQQGCKNVEKFDKHNKKQK